MPQNIFKIYDGRVNFWQWDAKQKLIVLDNRVTEVRFSNRNMRRSKRRVVYTDNDGVRVCNVPDSLLQVPKNLIAYACMRKDDGSCSTIKEVKFAVIQQSMPADYECEQDSVVDGIMTRIELLENLIRDVEQSNKDMQKFDNINDATAWAKDNNQIGVIVVVDVDSKWVPHMVENDFSLSPICDCDGEMIIINIDDGEI